MNAADPLKGLADGAAPMNRRLDNFELQSPVVQGPNGIVYRAWDHNLGIPVAIQEYLPMHLAWRKPDGQVAPLAVNVIEAFARGRQAFVNEARVLARCDHPSLLRVRQLLHVNGTSYKVMPWYEGRPLLDVRHDIEDPPDEPALRALLSDLLGALEAYHRVGGVHGSVNPSQILLLSDDRALLLGPGAARRDPATAAVEPLTQQQAAGFVAPEQLALADEARTGPWTDFFALARVVRFCISGMLPSPDAPAPEPAAAMVEKLFFDTPGVRYSANFLAALDAASSPAIEERPRTAAEFCDWLDHGPPRATASAKPADIPLPVAPSTTEESASKNLEPAGPEETSATVPAPVPTAAPAKQEESAADAETIALIQRVIESIPNAIELPAAASAAASASTSPSASKTISASTPEPAWHPERLPYLPDMPPPSAALPERSHRGLWLLAIVVVLCLGGYAAWMQQQQPASSAHPALASATPAPKPLPESVEEKEASASTAASLDAATASPSTAASAAPIADASQSRAAVEPSAGPPAQTASAPPPELPETRVIDIPATPKVVEVQAGQGRPQAATSGAAPGEPDNPRAACGNRTKFSLYRCMQQQCAKAAWTRHAQCVRLKATDQAD